MNAHLLGAWRDGNAERLSNEGTLWTKFKLRVHAVHGDAVDGQVTAIQQQPLGVVRRFNGVRGSGRDLPGVEVHLRVPIQVGGDGFFRFAVAVVVGGAFHVGDELRFGRRAVRCSCAAHSQKEHGPSQEACSGHECELRPSRYQRSLQHLRAESVLDLTMACHGSTAKHDHEGAQGSFDQHGRHQAHQGVRKRNLHGNDASLPQQTQPKNDGMPEEKEQGRGAVAHPVHLLSRPTGHQRRHGKGKQEACGASREVRPSRSSVGKHRQPEAARHQVQEHGTGAHLPAPQHAPQHHQKALWRDGKLPLERPNLRRQPSHDQPSSQDQYKRVEAPGMGQMKVLSEHGTDVSGPDVLLARRPN